MSSHAPAVLLAESQCSKPPSFSKLQHVLLLQGHGRDYPCPVKGDIWHNFGHYLHLTNTGDPGIPEITHKTKLKLDKEVGGGFFLTCAFDASVKCLTETFQLDDPITYPYA